MIQFIQNIGDYFSQNYFDEDFPKKVFDKVGYVLQTKKGEETESKENHISTINKKITPLRQKYNRFKNELLGQEGNLGIQRRKDIIKRTHEFHLEVLNTLGYTDTPKEYEHPIFLDEEEVIPVLYRFNKGDKPYLYIMEMQAMIAKGDTETEGIYDQVYDKEDWSSVFPKNWENYNLKPDVIKDALSELFLVEETERPTYVILLAAPKVFLIHYEKWKYDSYLLFDMEQLFEESLVPANRNHLSLFYALLAKEQFISNSESILDSLEQDAHKAAYGVTQSLKKGIIYAVENLANEAIYYKLSKAKTIEDKAVIETQMADDTFAKALKDECLTLVYRLLFLFYAEARSDLEILPNKDSVYSKGYSLEMLRDLEMVPLTTDSSRNGYFFSHSLQRLFGFLYEGQKVFDIKKIDSPLFDNAKLDHLKDVHFRNYLLQEIIVRMSLSERTKKKGRGRISYANLGINQLGSVYESLLAYTGFFAKETLIEVKNEKDKTGKEGTYLVPLSRRDDFKETEILKQKDHSEFDVQIPKGTFVYRLNGRDRKKSASYYTPEVLTQCTVKYTLKNILEDLRKRQENKEDCANEILELKILEPAMGAAAFHNEVINQLAAAYLELKQEEVIRGGGKRIVPGVYNNELQKVKAYIAANNVYGVDLNPTAIELGKLSLWLNVIHKDMETPFFGYRLGVGNAVVGAWLKVYPQKAISQEFETFVDGKGKTKKRLVKKEWWNEAPKLLQWEKGQIKRKSNEIYHFLLPDRNMVPSANIKLLRADDQEWAKAEAMKKWEVVKDKSQISDKAVKQHINEISRVKRVQKWRSDICQPVDSNTFKLLQRICYKVDELLAQHAQFMTQVDACTRNKIDLYGGYSQGDQCELNLSNYKEKEELIDKRSTDEAPYAKLKLVMDYWCSLWFWDVRHAEDLPKNWQEYIFDIFKLLDLDLAQATTDGSTFQHGIFVQETPQVQIQNVRKKETTTLTLDAITKFSNRTDLGNNNRFQHVRKYAEQYRFFHYHLEFNEVFTERGGFDVIVGNPPWVKWTFEIKEILAEMHPEVEIRSISAPESEKIKRDILNKKQLKKIIIRENIESECLSSYLNAVQNFPLLKGQQTNLYKTVIENSFNNCSKKGYIGLLHPDSIYEDQHGQRFRKEIYQRLKFHFQFQNKLLLFKEVKDKIKYGINVYSGIKSEINFHSINNLYHPLTIKTSYEHNGHGIVGGMKKKDKINGTKYLWNNDGHKSRIIFYNLENLEKLKVIFNQEDFSNESKLVTIHSIEAFRVLEKFTAFPNRVSYFNPTISECWHETNDIFSDQKLSGYIKNIIRFPDVKELELIYSGPHFFVANPLGRTPQKEVKNHSNFDVINLEAIDKKFVPRTKYIPAVSGQDFIKRLGKFKNKNWIDYYKVACSKMVDSMSERTLQTCIIPPNVSHISGVISVVFEDIENTIEFAGLTHSIILDFFLKTLGTSNLYDSRIKAFPLGIEIKYKKYLFSRTLRLNCLNMNYKALWENAFSQSFCFDNWSKKDKRLSPFNKINKNWDFASTPLKNYFERRMALVEIDVIVAMALDVPLSDLISIYNIQFAVMKKFEDNTWYDQKGNIVFNINSNGLKGVGVDSKVWNIIKDMLAGEVYEYTITKSELYMGEKVVYYAPFDKCDRVADYKEVWEYFEGVFANKK